ncbi:MAG: ubiquinol-cytochrome c reductase iron-sulfur subunit [Myxococcota bacterium]
MANLEILQREGCDPNQSTWSRRDFVGYLGWATVLGSLGIGTLSFVRLMYPRVLFEPRTEVKIGRPEEYRVDTVSERWIKDYRFWLVRTSDGFFALSALCTHLGCTPRWFEAENKFKCPCHGSGFRGFPGPVLGRNFEGPAPRPLERMKIGVADDGQIVVDKGKVFRFELGQWDDPDAFLKLSA